MGYNEPRDPEFGGEHPHGLAQRGGGAAAQFLPLRGARGRRRQHDQWRLCRRSAAGSTTRPAASAAVSGGRNTASGDRPVSGGYDNTASGDFASVSGGERQHGQRRRSPRSAGERQHGQRHSSVSGGLATRPAASVASVSGGQGNTASGDFRGQRRAEYYPRD